MSGSEHRSFERNGHQVSATLWLSGGVRLQVTRDGYRPNPSMWIDTPSVFVTQVGCAEVRGRWKPFKVLGVTLQRADTLEALADRGIAAIDRDLAERAALDRTVTP